METLGKSYIFSRDCWTCQSRAKFISTANKLRREWNLQSFEKANNNSRHFYCDATFDHPKSIFSSCDYSRSCIWSIRDKLGVDLEDAEGENRARTSERVKSVVKRNGRSQKVIKVGFRARSARTFCKDFRNEEGNCQVGYSACEIYLYRVASITMWDSSWLARDCTFQSPIKMYGTFCEPLVEKCTGNSDFRWHECLILGVINDRTKF